MEADSRTTRGVVGDADSRTTAGLIVRAVTAVIKALRRVFIKDTDRRIFTK